MKGCYGHFDRVANPVLAPHTIPDPDTDAFLRSLDFTESETFEFTIDTSGLPKGALMFETDVFLARMLRALDEGTPIVELSLNNAPEWGFRPEGNKERFTT